MGSQRIDEPHCLGRGQVLGDLEALHQVELSAEIDRCREIGGTKVAGVDQQAAPIDVRSVDPGHRCPGSGPHAQPRTLPASEIDDIADREDSRQPGHDPLRRANRERREKTVKVCAVLVHAVLTRPIIRDGGIIAANPE